MGVVGSFLKTVGTMALKGAVSATVGAIPVIGSAAAGWINSKYKRGGKVGTFADGGIVTKLEDKGFKTKEINTPAQLIAAVKKFPDAAEKAGLTLSMIKDAVAEHGPVGNAPSKEAPPELQPVHTTMKRGGRRGRVEELSVEHHHKKHHKKHHMGELSVEHHHKKHHKKHHMGELSVEPEATVGPKHHHKKHHMGVAPFAHGGMVSSLPWSNLNRLEIQSHAKGGYHLDTGMGLSKGQGEQSYVHLLHGGPRHMHA